MATPYESVDTIPYGGSLTDVEEPNAGQAPDASAGSDPAAPAPEQTPAQPQAAPVAGQPGTSGQPQPAWNGKEWALKFRGKAIEPPSREQLINWAQQGYNYDQRKTQLDQREQEITTLQKEVEQYKQLAEMFDQNEAFKAKVLELSQQFQAGMELPQIPQAPQGQPGQPDQNAPPPWFHQWANQFQKNTLTELQQLRQWKEQFEADRAKRDVDTEIKSLREQYPQEEWDVPDETTGKTLLRELVEEAAKSGLDLAKVYKYMRFDQHQDSLRKNAEAEALKKQQETALAAKRQGIVGGSPAKPKAATNGINIRGKSRDELVDMISERENLNLFTK